MTIVRRPLILIVEDEVIIAKDISEILTKEGFDCIYKIDSYQKAIDAIENLNPDLVLIDIILKKVDDGIKLGRHLYNLGTVPFVYLTSLSDRLTVLEVKSTFPFGYVLKPFKPKDLVIAVTLALNNFRHQTVDIRKMYSAEAVDDVPFILKKVIGYIHENLNSSITIEELSSLTRWKKHNFAKQFYKHLKITPYQYLTKCRIERFIVLLSTTTLPASDIAFDLGYNSYSNFSRVFKKNVGISIDEYRRKVAQSMQ